MSGTLAMIPTRHHRANGSGQTLLSPLPQFAARRLWCRQKRNAGLACNGTRQVGRPLDREFVHKRTKVLIVSLEDDAEELRCRVLAARIHHGVSAAELKDWLFLAAPNRGVGKLMMMNSKGRVVEGALGKTLEDVIVRREIGLIILDPFVKTHSVPENLNNEMDSVAQLLS